MLQVTSYIHLQQSCIPPGNQLCCIPPGIQQCCIPPGNQLCSIDPANQFGILVSSSDMLHFLIATVNHFIWCCTASGNKFYIQGTNNLFYTFSAALCSAQLCCWPLLFQLTCVEQSPARQQGHHCIIIRNVKSGIAFLMTQIVLYDTYSSRSSTRSHHGHVKYKDDDGAYVFVEVTFIVVCVWVGI